MRRARAGVALVVASVFALAGCFELAAIGVGAAIVSAEDRRTTGTQIEDEGIELRAANRISERFRDKVHVNVTAYNRNVLLTGEAPDAQTREAIERIVRGLPNVRAVTNDVQIAGVSSLSARASDAALTGKVKARFLEAGKFSPVHVKVVTEASVVYLLGIVTEKEAADAVEIARTTRGVRKVVKVFEYCAPTDEICRPRAAAPAAESARP